MKFQNPSLIFFLNRQTDTHTHGRTDRQAETNMLPLFLKLGALKVSQTMSLLLWTDWLDLAKSILNSLNI